MTKKMDNNKEIRKCTSDWQIELFPELAHLYKNKDSLALTQRPALFSFDPCPSLMPLHVPPLLSAQAQETTYRRGSLLSLHLAPLPTDLIFNAKVYFHQKQF